MKYRKFIYKNDDIKLLLEEDNEEVGCYFMIYDDPESETSSADYLFDTIDVAYKVAEKKYNVKKEQWTEIE